MINFIINTLRAWTLQHNAQNRLNALIRKRKKSDYIKIKIPKEYFAMIEVLAMWGVKDDVELLEVLKAHLRQQAEGL